MTLSSIALRNIQRNFKDYFVYFASMIFSIVIYFTFKALQYNSQMEKQRKLLKKLAGIPSFQCDAYYFRSGVYYIFERFLYKKT